MIDAIGLDNAGGFYYPIPTGEKDNEDVFEIFRNALAIDLKKMEIVDTMQLEQEQIYSSIAGPSQQEEMIQQPEEYVMTRVPNQGGGGDENQ